MLRRVGFALVAAFVGTALASCDGSSRTGASNAMAAAESLPPVDDAVWRTVGADDKRSFDVWEACAAGQDDLERADPSLKDRTKVPLDTLDAQVSRHGKLQAQCAWTGPDGRTGRIIVNVLCWNADNDRCDQFAYAIEGSRRINPVARPPEQPPPPVSNAFPPGRDEEEHQRSKAIIAWARDNAPEQLAALRADIRSVKVGIDATAKVPVLCGEVRPSGSNWRRFAVFSTGSEYNWLGAPKDNKGLHDFCDFKRAAFQWYAVPDKAMN